MTNRSFQDTEAVRENQPMKIALCGPTGSGKTGSALELATGFQDVFGGEIGVIDSEAGRSKSYAGLDCFSDKSRKFKFRHLDFPPPFGPHDYLAACEHFVKKGVKQIVVDTTSLMWEGQGGVLDMHEKEAERLALAWSKPDKKVYPSETTFPAWNKAKGAQNDFVQWMKQQHVNFFFCFRAKEKLKMIGKKPTEVGWQAIGGDDLLFEMDIACLLLPGSEGKPIWDKQEEAGVKTLHAQFRPFFQSNPVLSIEVGRKLAKWGKGEFNPTTAPADLPSVDELILKLRGCVNRMQLDQEFEKIKVIAPHYTKETIQVLNKVKNEVKEKLNQPTAGPDPDKL